MITLNSVSTSLAATDFLLLATGLMPDTTALDANAYYPQEREQRKRTATRRPTCRFCGDGERSLLARGDLKTLSLKPGARPRNDHPSPTAVPDNWVGRLKNRLARRQHAKPVRSRTRS